MKWLSYTIVIKTNSASKDLAEKCREILLSERVEVEKKTKSGDITVCDIRPLIKGVNSVFDGENIRISCVLSADATAFLNPEYIIKVLRQECGILSDENLLNEYYSIMRENAYLGDMSEFR